MVPDYIHWGKVGENGEEPGHTNSTLVCFGFEASSPTRWVGGIAPDHILGGGAPWERTRLRRLYVLFFPYLLVRDIAPNHITQAASRWGYSVALGITQHSYACT